MNPKKVRRVNLKITSWVGTSIGATHTYGRLIWKDGEERKDTELQNPMSAAEARQYNRENDYASASLRKKAGDLSDGFRDKGEVIKAGLAKAKELWPDGEYILIQSDGVNLSAQAVLHAPLRFTFEANRMTELAKEWDTSENDDEKSQRLDDEWYMLLTQICEGYEK